MFKKLIASIILASYFLVSVIVPVARAQETWYQPSYTEWAERVYDTEHPEEIFGERYTAAQVYWVIYSLMHFVLTALGEEGASCIIAHPRDLETCVPSLRTILTSMGFLSSNERQDNNAWLAMIGERPVSFVSYVKDLGTKLNIIPEAKAQGFGFEAASAVREIWRTVRDLTYFLLVLVIIAMAFAIMFRVRLSPQTVITVQSAIPRVIIALVLITFSYAIAGFVIDLMYVVIGLIAAIISNSGLSGFDWPTMFGALTNDRTVMQLMLFYFLAFLLVSFYALFSGALGFFSLLSGVGQIFWVILLVIVAIVLLFAVFRIFFMLIRTYVIVLLLIISSPLQILLGPLGGGGFGAWLKSMAANLAVFPATGLMFFIAFLFLRAAMPDLFEAWPLIADLIDRAFPFNVSSALGNSTWTPPLLVGTNDMDILWLFASVIVITLIPRTAEIIRGAITGRPFAFGTAVGEAWTGVTGMAGRGLGLAEGRGAMERINIQRDLEMMAAQQRGRIRPGQLGAIQRSAEITRQQEILQRLRRGLGL